MIRLNTIETAEPKREHLSMFKQYASVPDNSRDALLTVLLRSAMKAVQEAADKSLLPCTLELVVSEREDNDFVKLYQTPDEILSVTDGAGNALDFKRDSNFIRCFMFTPTVIVRYKTQPVLRDAEALLSVVFQYATALYDGESTDTLNKILAQC